MAKLTLTDIATGYSATSVINANNQAIETAIENTLSRDGSTPNDMNADLDMNGNKVTGLGAPSASTDAARWIDVTDSIEATGSAIPALAGNTLKYLGTDGSNLVWKDYYEAADVRKHGAVGDGTTDDTAAIQAAINTGKAVIFRDGVYRCANLTQNTQFQRFYGIGKVHLQKNANGPIITSSAADVEFNGIDFRGDASSPTFTGNGVVLNGDNPRLINCGCRWISGTPVVATGNNVQIIGSCDIYQTTDTGGTAYDIIIGTSGTATLYHKIIGVKTSQATGGFKFIDCGSQFVEACQFGKLWVDSGTSPAGVNGGNYGTNRILGDVLVDISNSAFAANTFGTVTITFSAGTSGHSFDDSNVLAAGATLTNNANTSTVIDSRQIPLTSYTPAWTAASVNPVIGNGTLTGKYTKRGRNVTVFLTLTTGGTTTYGTGVYRFSLPFVPATTTRGWGSGLIVDSGTANFLCVIRTAVDGTANCEIFAPNQASPTVPMTWASGDSLDFELTYTTD